MASGSLCVQVMMSSVAVSDRALDPGTRLISRPALNRDSAGLDRGPAIGTSRDPSGIALIGTSPFRSAVRTRRKRWVRYRVALVPHVVSLRTELTVREFRT